MKDRKTAEQIIAGALEKGLKTLSEFEAKQVLAAYGIPVNREILVQGHTDVSTAASDIGYPLVMKGCSADIVHKTEKNLVRVDIRNQDEADAAFYEITGAMRDDNGGVLVQEMVPGRRELAAGMTRDPQFGPCVMFGLGGIFTEILRDVTFRKAPIQTRDALEMMEEIRGRRILESIRGMEAADTRALADMLIRIGELACDFSAIEEIDLNPVILSGAKPIAVDALIILK